MPRVALDIPVDGGVIDATVHIPDEGMGPWPGVVMLSDIVGVRPAFFDMAEHLAAAGYVVLLPNVYWRFGRAPVIDLTQNPADPEFQQQLLGYKATLTVPVMHHDGQAMIEALHAREETTDGPIGLVGYCMSGPYAIHVADVAGDRVAAAAIYHGTVMITDDPESPHRVAARVAAALYFGHADDDQYLPQERIPELDRELSEAGRDFIAEVYCGSHHGFAVPGSHGFDQAGHDRHWRTMLQLFGRTLS